MSTTFRLLTLTALACMASSHLFAQAVITQPYTTVEEYVQNVLLGEGVSVSNITYTGGISQLGLLENGNDVFSVDAGLMLNTDNALCDDFCADCLGGGTDADLLAVANSVPPLIGQSFTVSSVNDLCIIEFDFEADGDSISFNYVFGSDEYLTFVNTQYNDIFAFFLSGPGIVGEYDSPAGFPDGAINIAEVPGTDGWPVTISSVNNVTNPEYYNDNPGQTGICTNGYTETFTAEAAVQCGEIYHIKLAIADGSDTALESFVVLEAGSFSSGSIELVADAVSVEGDVNLNEFFADMVDGIGNVLSYDGFSDFPLAEWVDWKSDTTTTSDFPYEISPGEFINVDAVVMEGCNDIQFQIVRPESAAATRDTLYLTVEGTATEGLDFSPLFTQVIMDVGETETLAILGTKFGNSDQGEEGIEYLTVSFDYINGCGELIVISSTVLIVDPLPIEAQLDEVDCHDAQTAEVEISYSNIAGFGPFEFDWVWQGDTIPEAENSPALSGVDLLDDANNLAQSALSNFIITDYCGVTKTYQVNFDQNIAKDLDMCTQSQAPMPVTNLSVHGVSDVRIDGVSIVGLTPSINGNPPVAILPDAITANDETLYIGDIVSGTLPGDDMVWEGTLSIIDRCGFETTSTIEVTSCAIPNVFTPNGDPQNDDFVIRGLLGQKDTELLIFNRNGQKIFESKLESNDVNELSWGGNYAGGDPAPEGVYQWILVRPEGEKEVGIVTLIR